MKTTYCKKALVLITAIAIFSAVSLSVSAKEGTDSVYLGHDHSSCTSICEIVVPENYALYAPLCGCGGYSRVSTVYQIGGAKGNCFWYSDILNTYKHYPVNIYNRYTCNSCGSHLGDVLRTSGATYCGYLMSPLDSSNMHGYV